MSVIVSTQAMNIVEAHKREGYKDSASFLAELAKKNDLLNVAPWYHASNALFHKFTTASRLGKGDFVTVNGGIPIISSSADPKIERIASYQGDSIVDDKLLKTAVNAAKVRDSEDVANTEGFVQDWISKLIYGNDPVDGLKGFAARRSGLDSKYTWGAGGNASTNSSLWMFEFGERGFNFRYPKGSSPGIKMEDKGQQYLSAPDGNGNMWAWVRHFEIYAGMELKNEKAMLRLANIESTGSTIPFKTMIQMKNQLPNVGRDAVIFTNRTIHGIIEAELFDKTNLALSVSDVEGYGPVVRFSTIPILMMEAILDTESTLS